VALNVASPQELETTTEPRERWIEPGHGVLVFTPGTSRRQTVNRMLCTEARIDTGKVRTGMLTSRDWEQLTHAAGRLASLSIWVNDTPDLSPCDIRSVAARLQAEFDGCDQAGNRTQRLGLIVIDGCRHLRGGRRALRRLRDLARDLMVPIIVTIALDPMASDPKGGKRPQLSDLPLSDDDADNVCFLHRDSYHDRDADPEVVELIVASQRNGPTDSVRLRWQPQYGRIDNLPQGEHDE
jgi:replicative DNA helicase